jgi:hypothetical protein
MRLLLLYFHALPFIIMDTLPKSPNDLIGGCIHKFPDWPPGARTASGIDLCH